MGVLFFLVLGVSWASSFFTLGALYILFLKYRTIILKRVLTFALSLMFLLTGLILRSTFPTFELSTNIVYTEALSLIGIFLWETGSLPYHMLDSPLSDSRNLGL